jgi:hypothetical protein
MPVACYAIGEPGIEDWDGVFAERYGIEPTGAVLVRPDGWVAWRALRNREAGPDDLRGALRKVLPPL